MDKLKEYYKLEKSADKYFGKYEAKCAEILHLIIPMIDIIYEECSVFKQAGDDYVLCWEYEGANNTPVECIIKKYEKQGQLLTEEELKKISI